VALFLPVSIGETSASNVSALFMHWNALHTHLLHIGFQDKLSVIYELQDLERHNGDPQNTKNSSCMVPHRRGHLLGQVILNQVLTSQQGLVSNNDRTIVISLTGPQAWYLIK
jgi:hypothetical protein